MDSQTLTRHLSDEYELLSAALAAAGPDARVPSCPDWTAAQLEEHVAVVYQHKVEAMRRNAMPKPWPPPEGIAPLPDAWAWLTAEFAARPPEQATPTWFDPDQTVGFWIRRMAQETAIHRVDAQLTAGADVTPIAADLAEDGIDEVLRTFVVYAAECWPEDFADVLPGADPRPVRLTTGRRGWLVTVAPAGIAVTDDDHGGTGAGRGEDAAATVTAPPDLLYRWLWNRSGEHERPRVDGDESLVSQLRAAVVPALQ
jgi:uncharacterized protein (TIGR03083 family)